MASARVALRCEALNLRTLMSKTSRWKNSPAQDVPDRLFELARRADEYIATDSDSLILIEPFLALVRDPSTSGPITSLALSSLRTFIIRRVFHPQSPNLNTSLDSLVDAISHCKFDSSDAQTDHRVLDTLVSLINTLLAPEFGFDIVIADDSYVALFDTLIAIVTHPRLPDLLRAHARLALETLINRMSYQLADPVHAQNNKRVAASTWPRLQPFVHCIRSLVGFIDPTDNNHTDSRRILGLDLMVAALDSASHVLSEAVDVCPDLDHLLLDRAARHLFLLARRVENLQILVDTFRTLASLVDALRPRLKLQIELLLSFFVDLLISAAPPRLVVYDPETEFDEPTSSSTTPAGAGAATTTTKTSSSSSSSPSPYAAAESLYDNNPEVFIDDDEGVSNSLVAGGNTESVAATLVTDSPHHSHSHSHHVLSPEALQLFLEYLVHFSTSPPSTFPSLWLAYDCSLDCEDMFERLIGFFASGVFPSPLRASILNSSSVSSSWSQGSKAAANAANSSELVDPVQRVCLDVLVDLLSGMADRIESPPLQPPPPFPSSSPAIAPPTPVPHQQRQQQQQQQQQELTVTPDQLRKIKRRKRLLLRAAQLFNSKPSSCLQFLKHHDLVNPEEPDQLADFLLSSSSRLDKRLLGEFLSKPDNASLLSTFISKLGFEGKTCDEAWRDLLERFRLPGESQQIERIAESFSRVFFSTKPQGINSQDATFILTFSIAMLNTDLHNPSQKQKMSFNDYRRNLRGVNDGQDFDDELLKSIYDNIRHREIVVPEEHAGQMGFEYAWKELIRRSQSVKELGQGSFSFQLPSSSHDSFLSTAYDAELLDLISKPTLEALTYALTNFDDESLLQSTITAFQHAATLATAFERPDLLDRILARLATNTRLTVSKPPLSKAVATSKQKQQHQHQQSQQDLSGVPSNLSRVKYDENSVVTLSPLSIAFGNDVKAQLAAVVLFSIANGSANYMKRSWSLIFQIYRTLFAHSLLPSAVNDLEDFLGGSTSIPMRASTKIKETNQSENHNRPGQAREVGLLSTLSSYLISPYSFGNGNNSNEDADDDSPSFVSRGDVSEKDIEATLCTVDCVGACKLDEFYSKLPYLPNEALLPAVESLIDLLQKSTIDKLRPRTVKVALPEENERSSLADSSTRSSSAVPTPSQSPAPGTPPSSNLYQQQQQHQQQQQSPSQAEQGNATVNSSDSTIQLPYDSCSVFLLEVLVSITCRTSKTPPESLDILQSDDFVNTVEAANSRIQSVAPLAFDVIFELLHYSSSLSPLLNERITSSLFKLMIICISNKHIESLRSYVYKSIDALSNLPSNVLESVAEEIAIGLNRIFVNEQMASFFESQHDWEAVFSLWSLTAHYESAARISFEKLKEFSKELEIQVTQSGEQGLLRAQYMFVPLVYGLSAFVDAVNTKERKSQDGAGDEAAIKRALEVFEILKGLWTTAQYILNNSHEPYQEGWKQFWMPVLTKYSSHVVSADRDVRSAALGSLQRSLVTDDALTDGKINVNNMVFDQILFPVLDDLLKPQTLSRDTSGIGETRLRASNMLCKCFLQYVGPLSSRQGIEGVVSLWIKILGYLDRFMHSGKRDQMYEAVVESLKNVLLVLNTSGILKPPHEEKDRTQGHKIMWDQTFEHLETFQPGMMNALFPRTYETNFEPIPELRRADIKTEEENSLNVAPQDDQVPNEHAEE